LLDSDEEEDFPWLEQSHNKFKKQLQSNNDNVQKPPRRKI
jgi:hypothetical protein